MSRKSWTADEVKMAIVLYCKLPFGQLHSRNPEVMALAQLLGRSAGSVAMKLCNLASLDPAITTSGRKGLDGASALDREVWAQFAANWDALATEAEWLLRDKQAAQGIAEVADVEPAPDVPPDYSAETRRVLTEQRIKQNFFRKAVLVSYDHRCCITGIAEPKLLVASHIVPWAADPANRLNPANGLCLSALHDRAFDQGLLTLDADYRVLLSRQLLEHADAATREAFGALDGQPIRLPERFRPDPVLLDWHRQHLFTGR